MADSARELFDEDYGAVEEEQKMSQAFACDLHENKKQVDVTEIRYIHQMWLRGKDGECCGVTYGDIRPLEGYPETLCMHIYEQVNAEEMATNELKTANAYRVLPVPTELAELIHRRKKRIEAKVWEDVSEYYRVQYL